MHPEEQIEQPKKQSEEQTDYEAPRIESAMTPEDLQREVAYAGITDRTLPEG
jgi:hypothetical protein